MAFEGLRDQLKEQWIDLSAKIQETQAFNTAREKFESQPPNVQKVIVLAVCALAALFLISFPYSYWSQSSEYLSSFEENRELIQGLLQSSRNSKTPAPIPAPLDIGTLRSKMTAVTTHNRILPEQVGQMQDMARTPAKNLIPSNVTQNGVVFQLKRLNLSQVVSLANEFHNLGNGTKLMGLDIFQSAGQTHYYDMNVKVVNFGLSQDDLSDESTPSTSNPRKNLKGRPMKSRTSETDGDEG